jgi:Skp family chaperone for outer membrane proteins
MDWAPISAILVGLFSAAAAIVAAIVNRRNALTAAQDASADNEAALRKDLFAELRRIRKERDDLATVHTRDIAHLQRRLTAQETELAAQREQLRQTLEDARAMQRQLITLGQEMVTYRAAMRDLQTREYTYWQYWNAIDQQGRVLHEIEWAEIKKAVADQNIPRPLWPQANALLQSREEGPTTDE